MADTVIEMTPNARTRLLHAEAKEPDFTSLYVSTIFTTGLVCLSVYWIYNNGLESSPLSWTILLITVGMLAFNAFLGWKTGRRMRKWHDMQYAEYVNRLSQLNTHEKLNRICPSPVWINRVI